MAEEDLIFGQKRHLFGGIAPGNMRRFEFRSPMNYKQLPNSEGGQLIAILPDHTIIDGQVVCSVAGAVIRRKRNGYPIDEFDGEKVADISTSQILTISDWVAESAEAWYYSAFPYSTQGVYNRNSENRCADIGKRPEDCPYGYDVDLNNVDPATRVSYPPEVRNYGWVPAIDLEHVGQHWNEAAYMPYPGVMSSDMKTFIRAGEFENEYAKLSYPNFNFLMQWPLLYIKRTVENSIYKFRVFVESTYDGSRHAEYVSKGYDCWNNYAEENDIVNHFYTSIYPISEVKDDRGVTRYVSHPTFFRDVKNIMDSYFNGTTLCDHNTLINYNAQGIMGESGFKATDRLVDIDLIFDLLTMMFKNTNLAKVMYNSSSTAICGDIQEGIESDDGIFSLLNLFASRPFGCYYADENKDRKLRTKIFGMYNLFDNRMITGLVSNNGRIYTKFTPNAVDGSLGTNFNYQNKSNNYKCSASLDITNGYISDYKYNRYDNEKNEGPIIGRSPVGYLNGVAGFSDNLYCEHITQSNVDYIPVLCIDDKRHYIKFVPSFATGYKFGLSIKSHNVV